MVRALALAMLRARRSRFRLSPRAIRRRCRFADGAAGVSSPRGSGAILTGMVVTVRRSGGGCKTPDGGTGAGRMPDDGYSARAAGRTSDFPDSGVVSGACVTARSHQGACETFASSIWPRARAAVSTIASAMMHALFLTRRPGATNFRNLTCRGQWAFHWRAPCRQNQTRAALASLSRTITA
jgi:hypothetical protein